MLTDLGRRRPSRGSRPPSEFGSTCWRSAPTPSGSPPAPPAFPSRSCATPRTRSPWSSCSRATSSASAGGLPVPRRVVPDPRVQTSAARSSFSTVCVLDRATDAVYVDMRARTSGDFRVDVTLASPEGDLALAGGELTVRSISTSAVAIALSAAAVVVLALWWGVPVRGRGRRPRRGATAVPWRGARRDRTQDPNLPAAPLGGEGSGSDAGGKDRGRRTGSMTTWPRGHAADPVGPVGPVGDGDGDGTGGAAVGARRPPSCSDPGGGAPPGYGGAPGHDGHGRGHHAVALHGGAAVGGLAYALGTSASVTPTTSPTRCPTSSRTSCSVACCRPPSSPSSSIASPGARRRGVGGHLRRDDRDGHRDRRGVGALPVLTPALIHATTALNKSGRPDRTGISPPTCCGCSCPSSPVTASSAWARLCSTPAAVSGRRCSPPSPTTSS